MHNSLVKDRELDMLVMFYKYHGSIPECNPPSDLRRVQLRIENEN